jgi:hypothetical protein
MSESTPEGSGIKFDTIIDNRTALYDQVESKPYRLLQEDITELLTSTVEAAGRDASDVKNALLSDPLDEDWWFSITTQQALDAIVVTGEDDLIRVDITYELGDEKDLTVPSPDALPILDDGDKLTIYCLSNRDTDLSGKVGNVVIKGVSNETDNGNGGSDSPEAISISLIGPEDQQNSVSPPPDKQVGFLVSKIKQSYEVYDAEIGLYEDEQHATRLDDTANIDQYDEKTVYWQIERRAA